jgi:hypothetical protein
MPIPVTCPGCHKRFNVSDKFAGKEGPCPSCKVMIKIPKEVVKVHGGESFAEGGRSVDGKLVLKPLERSEAVINPVRITAIVATGIVMLAVAVAFRGVFVSSGWAVAIGLLIVSPVLAVAGYAMLRSADDLEPLHGKELYVRALICGVAYSVVWWIFGQITGNLMTGEIYEWFYVVPLLFLGGLLALGSLDLDFPTGMIHFGFYAVVTFLLRWIVGLPWVWEMVDNTGGGPPVPTL